jgi:hypothetical protein
MCVIQSVLSMSDYSNIGTRQVDLVPKVSIISFTFLQDVVGGVYTCTQFDCYYFEDLVTILNINFSFS